MLWSTCQVVFAYSLREGRQAGEGEQFEMDVWTYFQPFGTS